MALRILLATDGSEPASLAVRSIATRPWPVQTEVRILSVVEMPHPVPLEPPVLDIRAERSSLDEAAVSSQHAVQDAIRIFADHGFEQAEAAPLLRGSPKQVILDEARRSGTDLIVVGSHGRGGISRILLGGVSEAVAMHAECSVEVIRGQRN